jgi:CRISPR-associated RAMP protein (TIGR02581 family)
MLRKILNQAILELTIDTRGPLLIKSGIEGGADPSVPDMQFVRSGGQVYIPGSSLKGVFRSYAEKIARTVGARCCNPFDNDPESPTCSCSKHAQIVAERVARGENRGLASTEIYRRRDCTCRICQLFGSTAIASRIKFNDAYIQDGHKPTIETRTGVAIDRVLGSVAHGPFDFEVVTKATFQTDIYLRNFELWQLGLVALVLRDMEEGLVPLGFGKSRGLGEVKVQVTNFSVRYIVLPQQSPDPTHMLYGVGALATEGDRSAYGLSPEDKVTLSAGGKLTDDELGVRVIFDPAARLEAFRRCVNERWREVVQNDRGTN